MIKQYNKTHIHIEAACASILFTQHLYYPPFQCVVGFNMCDRERETESKWKRKPHEIDRRENDIQRKIIYYRANAWIYVWMCTYWMLLVLDDQLNHNNCNTNVEITETERENKMMKNTHFVNVNAKIRRRKKVYIWYCLCSIYMMWLCSLEIHFSWAFGNCVSFFFGSWRFILWLTNWLIPFWPKVRHILNHVE